MKTPILLLVEDNPDDVTLVREALRENAVTARLEVVGDGQAAVKFLKKLPPYEDAPTPDLVLLDLNLPLLDGRSVLTVIKTDEELLTTPVVVLTTSKAPEDVQGSYARHCNAYVVKPIDFEDFADIIHKLKDFWLEAAKLPAHLF
jgi:CheY-like chemotaxis protein